MIKMFVFSLALGFSVQSVALINSDDLPTIMSVDPVTGIAQVRGGTITDAEAYLICAYSDIGSIPSEAILPVKVRPATEGAGHPKFELAIDGGEFEFVPNRHVRNCYYQLTLAIKEDDGTTRYPSVVLAGSKFGMNDKDVQEFVKDQNLAKEITRKISPMTVIQDRSKFDGYRFELNQSN